MKIAVFGAGALGGVYGVRLAVHGGVDVTFIVRPARAASSAPIAIETVRKGRRDTIAAPAYATEVPPDTDAILLAVGTEDLVATRLDGGSAEGGITIDGPLGSSDAPIVILTPMLPKGWARVRRAFGGRAYAAMPNVAAYARRDDGVIRYWLLPATTKIDEPRAGARGAEAVRALAHALRRAGLRGELELAVHETNPATTVAYIAIGMGLAVAGSAAALAADDALLELVARACREGSRLAYRIGTPELFVALTPVVSAPWALRAWLGALGRLSPEALFYAEEHFSRKLVDQHRLMAREMSEIAEDKGLPHAAIDALAERLDAGAPRA